MLPDSHPSAFRSFVRFTIVVGLLVLAAGCDWLGAGGSDDTPPPRPLMPIEKQVVETEYAFGLKLLRATVDGEESSENVFLSPISVSMVLDVTLNGAGGDIREAMEATLEKQDLSGAEINDAYRGLIDLFEGLDSKVEVALANSVWYRQGLPVRQAFVEPNRAHFDAEVAGLDFSDPSPPSRSTAG